ncbi:PD-(D/E)XK nuclease family protein [Oculatella sp. LEGE 06141]|uniref:PD-(D/E)XK nuclease family protein n=1 Tax=Oculatella sp. LEGE 06141 TaxID=1828648 RepID=UPI0018820175|nr:PD-(D/E)XK nuclease family protein [Oculatella sp. LEGE 06141]MBE9177917.1 PD-(D/E)XK nuclease family protein [Oculatella sp. LEGE 06141]
MTNSAKRSAGRGYLVDDHGVRLPSVTTILNATKPQADRDSLQQWRQRVGTAEAMRISGSASRRGTLTHKQIKSYLIGEEIPCPEDAKPYWESFKPVLGRIHDVQLVESKVFHYDLGYAGKVDCVASYQGVPCICDWKTADRPKGSIERLYDGPLQLAAYCGAVNHLYAAAGTTLSHALLAVAIPDQPAEVFWFSSDAMRDYWQQWQERVALFYQRF